MKLVELLRKYSEGECVDTLVPEALLKQNDDWQDNELSPGMIGYVAEFHSINLEVQNSVNKVLKYDIQSFYPGHGNVFDINQLIMFGHYT